MTPEAARRNARLAGTVTALLGPPLAAFPEKLTRLTGIDDPALVRLIGLSDIALAPGLLLAPDRWPWLAARALVNAAVGVRLLREPTTSARITGLTMLYLTVVDGRSAATLRAAGQA